MNATTDKKYAKLKRLLQEARVDRLMREIVQAMITAKIKQIGEAMRQAGFNL